MKRLVALAVGVFGLRALIRRHRRSAEPADELREKLAAQRTAEPAPAPVAAEAEAPATPDPVPEPVAEREPDDVDARRADVHARARKKIDELAG